MKWQTFGGSRWVRVQKCVCVCVSCSHTAVYCCAYFLRDLQMINLQCKGSARCVATSNLVVIVVF